MNFNKILHLSKEERKVISTLIYSANSETNFNNYLLETGKSSSEAVKEFDFETINSFVRKYINVSNLAKIKNECFFTDFKTPFHLVGFKKRMYVEHFYNKDSLVLEKIKVDSLYSKIGFKFVSIKYNDKIIPMIMVSLTYVPTREGFFLVPLLKNESILSIKRNDYHTFNSLNINEVEDFIRVEFNKVFYLQASQVLKRYKIRRKDFINYSFDKAYEYLNLACIIDY